MPVDTPEKKEANLQRTYGGVHLYRGGHIRLTVKSERMAMGGVSAFWWKKPPPSSLNKGGRSWLVKDFQGRESTRTNTTYGKGDGLLAVARRLFVARLPREGDQGKGPSTGKKPGRALGGGSVWFPGAWRVNRKALENLPRRKSKIP